MDLRWAADASWLWLAPCDWPAECEAGAAGGEAGDYPGVWGIAAVAATGGQGVGDADDFGGEMITAQEAHRIGLVNEVTSAAELIPRAEAIAARIIATLLWPCSMRWKAVNKGMEMTLAEGLYLEAVLFAVACSTEDKQEGTTAVSGEAAGTVSRGSRTSCPGSARIRSDQRLLAGWRRRNCARLCRRVIGLSRDEERLAQNDNASLGEQTGMARNQLRFPR